jgi:serine protease Do
MPNITIHHLSGTKANQVEEFPLQNFHEVLIGREANAQIRFDADREDLVSRNHARIVRDPADPAGFLLTDLESRNGTFLNHRRIYGTERLQHGDQVQLGPAGPEFTFELNPPPPLAMRQTRQAEFAPAPATRDANVPPIGSVFPPGLADGRPASDVSRPMGRATFERRIEDFKDLMKGESRKTMWATAIGLLVLLVAGAGYFAWNRQQQIAQDELAKQEQLRADGQFRESERVAKEAKERLDKIAVLVANNSDKKIAENLAIELKKAEDDLAKSESAKKEALEKLDKSSAKADPKPPAVVLASTSPALAALPEMTPEQIHAANAKSVILIEATWKVTDTGTGAQLYLYQQRNDWCKEAKGEILPVFIEDAGKLNPVLTTLANNGVNTPVVGTSSGSGFIIGTDGFFLTNRHVLAPWRAAWNVSNFTKKAWGLKIKDKSIVGCIPASEFPAEWIPSEGSSMVVDKIETETNPVTGGLTTKSTGSTRLKYNSLRTSVRGDAEFNVTFAQTNQRYRATSITLSEKHDVALGKVDVPSPSHRVNISSDADSVKAGQSVVVMGYPAISPDVFGAEVSRDMLTLNRTHLAAIADPTLTTGPVSKVLPSGTAVRGVDGVLSAGEVYQLGINTTGAGNSGGPVFDSKGRVVGIFYAARTYAGASVTYAVPVKFGTELIDNPSLIK